MADAMSSTQDLFTCPVCLDILRDPVTIPCGHNYCMSCIKACWDQEDQKGVYSCPECRRTFTPRPVLKKNCAFADVVEQFRNTRDEIVVPPLVVAGAGDVECDVCTGRKLKAVKSCLDCVLSYCDTHYKAHNDVNPGRKHKVVDATGQLQERICTQHEKPLEIFCRTDQTFVCFLCMVDEHKGHDTVIVSAERKEKQAHLGKTRKKIRHRFRGKKEELQQLRKAVYSILSREELCPMLLQRKVFQTCMSLCTLKYSLEYSLFPCVYSPSNYWLCVSYQSSAQTAVDDSERVFTEMIESIKRRRSEVTKLIRGQEKAEVSWPAEHQRQLEQEIAELQRRDAELEQLSHTEDHIYFLKTFQSVSQPPESAGLLSQVLTFSVNSSSETVKKFVSSLNAFKAFWNEEFMKIPAAVTDVLAMLPTEPISDAYSCHLTLDPNTTHSTLHLSEGNRRVERRQVLQSYPDHPERFDGYSQVLCREGVSGRCYWEVERSNWVYIAVSYESISRKGDGAECVFGRNDQSWSLDLRGSPSFFRHNNKETKLPLVASSRIGVYVDHRAGTLAFYSISDTMTLLHRVQTTFTQALYPGFALGWESSLKLL
ncbi:E3 ubiquitin/ISG15 ligase TRIM25-like [Sardina pilchardus]|uniref:E3 ubiquitin/ISG15 ligase TRIM25-like n=1 Tax=Sardina pilchardus TaxID=27697 RepID=UPI002E15353D